MTFTFKISVRLAISHAFVVLAGAACELPNRHGTGPTPPNVVQVVSSPETVVLDPFQQQQFLAFGRTDAGDSVAVTVQWSASGGGITAAGRYTADTAPGDFQVTATLSGANVTGSSSVKNRGPVAQVIVTPATASTAVGASVQFAAYGRKRNGDSVALSVTWSATGGTISGAGRYTAGQTAGMYRVLATQSGGTLADSATVTITAAPPPPPPPPPPPGTVNDLAVAGVSDSSVTLSFTEVTDGTGLPASYEMRFATGTISWPAASDVTRGSCTTPVAGTAIGARRTCTVLGLTQSTAYQFQMSAFRGTLNVNAVFGAISNVASGTTTGSGSGGGTVLLQENFEDNAFAGRGWYDNTAMATTTAQHIPGSTRALEVHFTAGSATPTWGGAARHLFAASSTLYISYWVKYSANWVGSAHPYHPHEFLVMSDLDGDWDGPSNNWLTLYVEHNYQNGGIPRLQLQDNKAINTSMGALPVNLVGVTENRSVGGCNGVVEASVVTTCFNMPPWYNDKEFSASQVWFKPTAGAGYKGDWNHVEVFFQLNSIAGGVGVPDGVMQYWFNGTLVIDRHDVLFRTGARPTLRFHQFLIGPYIGDGSPVDQYMWVDDLTVATKHP